MALTERLSRFGHFARFLAKYGRTDFGCPSDGSELGHAPSDGDAKAFAQDIEALGPTFIKLGQLLSTRVDLLSPAYVDALARLQDDVTPFPFAEAAAAVETELGVRISKAFTTFDPAPFAAASLSQVHRATLRSGLEVAVKVQRPGVSEQVRQDLEDLDRVVGLLERFGGATPGLDVPQVLDEFRRTILQELDFKQEATNLVTLAHQLSDIDDIVVPAPVDNYSAARVLTMDYIAGTKITAVNPVVWTEVDGGRLADTLFRAYLQQILIDGRFHADPHPGNVLLTTDRRLALIDLGMVGHLSTALQEQLFRLLLAIADGRGDEAGRVVIAIGEKREGFNEADLTRAVSELIARHRQTTAKGLNVGGMMLAIVRHGNRCGLRIPSELPLLGKALFNLHAIGATLDGNFDVNEAIRRHATHLMRRRVLKALTPTHMMSSALEFRELAERFPERLNRILESVAANDLRLKVEVIDHGSIIDGLQKVANRIALGIVLAALIVGAAMLMRVETPLRLFGYPALSMILFLTAAAGGFWMAWTILAGDVKRTRAR